MIEGLIEGRIVHYVAQNGRHVPAIVVADNHTENGSANLQVFVDGTNALIKEAGVDQGFSRAEAENGVAWRTSVEYAEHRADPATPPAPPHTWHFIERA